MTNSVRDPIVPGDPSLRVECLSDSHSLKISELTEALEKATGPDRELDAQIWCAIHNQIYKPEHVTETHSGQLIHHGWNVPAYTASIDAAMTLVDCPVHEMGHLRPDRAEWYVVLGNKIMSQARLAVPAIALCIAALRARTALEGTK